MIHVERVVEVGSAGTVVLAVDLVRWYEGDDGFAERAPYVAVATLLWTGARVEICGLHGRMTRAMRAELSGHLVAAGAQIAAACRRGRMVEWRAGGVSARRPLGAQ